MPNPGSTTRPTTRSSVDPPSSRRAAHRVADVDAERPHRARTECDLGVALGDPPADHRRSDRPALGIDADRGHRHAVELDVADRARRPRLHGTGRVEERGERRRRRRRLLGGVGAGVDPHVPVPAEQARRRDQMIEARREHDRAGDRRDREERTDDRRAHRDRGPPAAGLERHPHAGGHRQPRAGGAERSRETRRPRHVGVTLLQRTRARRSATRGSQRGRARPARRRPRRRPGRSGSTRSPGSGSAVRAAPIGVSGDSAIASTNASSPPSTATIAAAQHRGLEPLATREPERVERRVVDGIEEALPRQRLPDDEQAGERDNDREHGERARPTVAPPGRPSPQ